MRIIFDHVHIYYVIVISLTRAEGLSAFHSFSHEPRVCTLVLFIHFHMSMYYYICGDIARARVV